MIKFFSQTPQPGIPICAKGIANGLAGLDRALANLAVHNGHVDWSNGIPTIVMDAYEEDRTQFWRADDSEEDGDFITTGEVTAAGFNIPGDLANQWTAETFYVNTPDAGIGMSGNGFSFDCLGNSIVIENCDTGININGLSGASGTYALSTITQFTVTCGIVTDVQ